MKISTRIIFVTLVLIISPAFVLADEKEDLLGILRIYDEVLISNFSIQAEVSKPASVKDSVNIEKQALILSGTKNNYNMIATALTSEPKTFTLPPSINPSRSPMSHVGYEYKQQINYDGHSWILRSELLNLGIDTDTGNVITSDNLKPIYKEYGKDNLDAKNQYFRYLNSIGRGYADLIENILEIDFNEDNIYIIKASGYCYSPHEGIWTLKIDPETSFLVREASFKRNDSDDPTLTMACDNPSQTEISIGMTGWLSISDYRIDLSVKEYQNIYDSEIGNIVASELRNPSRYEQNTLYLDYIDARSDGIPYIRKKIEP